MFVLLPTMKHCEERELKAQVTGSPGAKNAGPTELATPQASLFPHRFIELLLSERSMAGQQLSLEALEARNSDLNARIGGLEVRLGP